MIDLRKGKIFILFSLSFLFVFSSLSQAQITHFIPCYGTQAPFQPMNIYVYEAQYNGQDLVAGDEIAVYDGDVCVGAEILTDVLSISNILQLRASKFDETVECGFA